MEWQKIQLQEEAKRLYSAQQWDVACPLYEYWLADEPENGQLHAVLGEILANQGEMSKAVDYFRTAVLLLTEIAQTDPQSLQLLGTTYFLFGLTQLTIGQRKSGIMLLQQAAEIRPDWVEPHLKLGSAYFEQGQHEQALTEFRTATQLSPEDGSAWLTVAYLERILGNTEATIEVAQKVLQLDPDSDQAALFLAEALHKTTRSNEAIPHFEAVVRRNGNHVQALYGYGQALLSTGDLQRGWMGFEARRLCENGTWNQHLLPDWNGENNPNQTVLAFAESGMPYEILYASCLNDLMKSVGHCYIECHPFLHKLFARSFPEATIISPSETAVVPTEYPGIYFDSQVAFGSLPRFFRSQFETFPADRKRYLIPNPQKTHYWKALLSENNSQYKIGILYEGCWTQEPVEQCRIPLDAISRILQSTLRNTQNLSDDVTWVSLQHGNQRKIWEQYCQASSVPIANYPSAFTSNFDDLAALMASLDLVITPSGFQAHLAAAIGVPCWVVLPEACDWRWHLSKDFCPWYPNARLFRQAHGETWAQTTCRLIDALQEKLNNVTEHPTIIPFPQKSDTLLRKIG